MVIPEGLISLSRQASEKVVCHCHNSTLLVCILCLCSFAVSHWYYMLTFPFSRHSNKKYWHFHNSTLIINTVVFVQFCIMSSILHLTRHVINLLIWCFKAGKILFSFLFDIHIWLSGCDTFWFCRGTTVCGLWLCYWSINPFLCWIRFSFHFLYCDFPL
jgi:hypothetical protein